MMKVQVHVRLPDRGRNGKRCMHMDADMERRAPSRLGSSAHQSRVGYRWIPTRTRPELVAQ